MSQENYSLLNDQPIPDWVKDRGNCTTTLGFHALEKIVERDVQQANELSPQLRGHARFHVECNGQALEPAFRVIRRVDAFPDMEGSNVVFVKKQTYIEITCSTHPTYGKAPILVIPSWDAKNHQCHWSIDKTPYAIWQVSQEVLSHLFFHEN